MFTKKKSITSSTNLMSYYIDGKDIFNSKLLRVMTDPKFTKVSYIIDRFEYRPDLIAQEFYGSEDFQGLLMFQTKLKLEEYTKGRILYLLPKSTLLNIIENL